jgi:hypothetical protein
MRAISPDDWSVAGLANDRLNCSIVSHCRCAWIMWWQLAQTSLRSSSFVRYGSGRYHAAELQAAQQGATIGETYQLPGYCRAR